MGSSSSTQRQVEELAKHEESDERRRLRLNEQLEELKQELTTVEPAITTNVRETVCHQQDALLMRYSQLIDKEAVIKNIQELFAGFPLLEAITDTATRMVTALTSTDELQEILRWQERTKVVRIGDKVYGMEAHYKVKVLEESKGHVFNRSKDTVVLIAYKCTVYAMDHDPKDFPDDQEHKKLTF